MNTPLKWIVYSSAAVVSLTIVVIVAGILILTNIDFGKYRETVEKRMSEQLGQQVSIKGDFEVDVGFHSSVKLSDMVIANAKWGKQPNAVKIGELYLRVSMLSLLGRPVIDKIVLKNADISLETKDGKSNLGGKDQPEAAEKSQASDDFAVKEIFDSIPIIAEADIGATNIHVVDHDNDTHRQIRIASIATKEKGRGAEMSVNISDIIQNGESLGNLTAEVALDKKSLVVRSLRQGSGLRGTLEYKADSQFRTDINLKGFRLETIDVLLGNDNNMRGALDGKIALRGEGNNTKKILSNLEGQVNLSSGQVIYGKSIPLLNLVEFANLSTDLRGCVLLIAPVNEGIVSLDAATSSTNIGTVKANGYIDLGQEKLDVIAGLNLGIPPALSARGPIKITGDFDNPNINRDGLSLNVDVARIGESVEGAVEGVAGAAESVIELGGTVLSNLFGGGGNEEENSQPKQDTSLAKCRDLAKN